MIAMPDFTRDWYEDLWTAVGDELALQIDWRTIDVALYRGGRPGGWPLCTTECVLMDDAGARWLVGISDYASQVIGRPINRLAEMAEQTIRLPLAP